MSGVLFYVQHLLGIGHLRRAGAIARAIKETGVPITMVSGGEPIDEIGFGDVPVVQLPPCRSGDISFKSLVDLDGNPLDEAWEANRRDQLLALFDEMQPDMVLLEMFPFGRRKFRFELLPLLEKAKQ
ncbi:MAG: glycosyl transferase, partial [Pseudomonadota bacterium]